MARLTASDFSIVYLTGGDAGNAYAALATDCTGCGRWGDRPAYEWAALVQPSRLDELLSWTGAEQVYGPVPWDGRPFGDGNGGTVGWTEGASAPEGDGMYEQAWARAVGQSGAAAEKTHSDMTVTLSLENNHKALVCTSCLSAAPSYAEAARRARPDRRSTYTGVLRGAVRLPTSVLRDCERAERRAAILQAPVIRALDSGDGLLERAVDEILAERPGATAQEIAEALRAAEVRS